MCTVYKYILWSIFFNSNVFWPSPSLAASAATAARSAAAAAAAAAAVAATAASPSCPPFFCAAQVMSVSIKRDRATGKNLGYGFVKLSSHQEARAAKEAMQVGCACHVNVL